MKKIFLFLAGAIVALTSCNMGEDGNAYLSIDYSDEVGEPLFVSVSYDIEYNDGETKTITLKNAWDWGVYYEIDRGDYLVHWEHEYKNERNNKTIRVANEAVIEIWIDPGRTKHRDGVDVYFDLVLFDEDYVRFTHEKDREPRNKSFDIASNEKTPLYTKQEQKGAYTLKYTVYKVTEYEVED